MTKDHALTGLRLGYLLASRPVVERVGRFQHSWSVNAAAQAAGIAALADPGHVERGRAAARAGREYLRRQLARLELPCTASAANFLLVRVGDAAAIRMRLLREHRVCVRDCASFGLPEHVRIGVRRMEDCRRLAGACRRFWGRPMGRWFLVRHGETDWNVEGRAQGQMHVPLNDKGLAQAEAIAARLRPMRFTAVYASDLRRVTQTAEPIMRGRDVPLVTLPALRERGFGEWEGLTFTEMEARFPERYAALFSGDDTSAAPGGESERQLYERVAAGVDRLLEQHGGDDGNLLVVAHGGSLCAAIVRLLALPSGSMERFSSGNCGLSIVTVYEGGFAALDLMNDRNHLESEP